MQFFIDSANLDDIRHAVELGMVDGITTNPTLISKEGKSFHEHIAAICDLVDGPVSAEVTALDYPGMLTQGRKLAKIAPNVTIKVPLTPDGLRACRTLSDEGTMVNVTLCFSAAQAILAAKAGASFISPFVGRLDDVGEHGMELISEIVDIYNNYDWETEVLVASIRHPTHVLEAARMGADVVTMPFKVLDQMYKHPLTTIGLDQFLADWKKSGLQV
ncbi:MAG TPA: fructose-6-phosphate aldolase [Gammaproteobacteria bacterium]|nr:fructose-6-phosphate aldolase [Gammaproteobacteria bacterium]